MTSFSDALLAFQDQLLQADSGGHDLGKALQATQKAKRTLAETHYQDGLKLESNNDIQGAIQQYLTCTSLSFDHEPALHKVAYLIRGDEAEKACRALLALDPCQSKLMLRLAQILMEDGRHLEAGKTLNQIILPADYELGFALELAHHCIQTGQGFQAEKILTNCLRHPQCSSDVYQSLLDYYLSMRRFDAVITLGAECTALYPEEIRPRLTIAQALLYGRKPNEVEQSLRPVLARDANQHTARSLLAKALQDSGDMNQAEALFRGVAEQSSNLHDWIGLADFYGKTRRKDQARNLCRELEAATERESWHGLQNPPIHLRMRSLFYEFEQISEKFCTGFRSLVDTTVIDEGKEYAPGSVVELFSLVVGQRYVNFLETISWEALKSTDQFTQLCQQRKVIYNIYTTPSDFPLLTNFLNKLTTAGVGYRVNVELMSFSPYLTDVYGLPVYDMLKRALKLNSIVFMAVPDAVYAGSLKRLIDDMKPGEVVSCQPIRVDEDLAEPYLRKAYAENGGISARELVRLSLNDFRHPQINTGVCSDSRILKLIEHKTHWDYHFYAPPAIAFYGNQQLLEQLLECPSMGPYSQTVFYAFDHDFLAIAHENNCLRVVPDSDYFCWAEMTNRRKYTTMTNQETVEYNHPVVDYLFDKPYKLYL